MKDFLAIIGGSACLFLIVSLICLLCSAIVKCISRIRRNYKRKHRFDKPPTAKCYCIDCVRHNNESKECYKFCGWCTSDSWFCWDAEPRNKEDIHEAN